MPLPGITSPLPRPSVGRWWQSTREFFAYHGVWAFGVRAMRLWSLRMKMVLLVAVMALPLLPLILSEIADRQHQAQQSGQRLAGLRVAQAVFDLERLLNLQAPLPTLADNPLAKALADLQAAVRQASQNGMSVDSVMRANQPALDRAVSPSAQSDAARASARDFGLRALAVIRNAVVDESHLTLNRSPVVAANANLAVELLPSLHHEMVQLRSLAARQAGLLAAAAPVAGEQHKLTVALAGTVADLARLEALSARAFDLAQGATRTEGERVMQLLRALLARAPGELLAAEPKVDLVTLQRELDEQLKGVELIQRHAFSDVQTRLSEANHAAETEALWLYGTLAGTTGLAAYLVYSFFLVMRGGLAKLNLQMSRMAQGDLSARPQGLGGDEVADTLAAMNVSLARLSDLLAAVRQGVGAITHASKQIASGNAELSERSKRSAEGLDQLMAGVTRYTDQLQDCSRSIESVVTTVQALRLASMRNRRHVVQLQERMGALRESSRAIGEIVTMIDTIAFRTNILALNAQVEASKAGDAGRGFAVVAQEVRALATRSAESARRVSDIVAGSGLQIEQAAALADETGGAIQVADGQVDAIHLAMSNVARLTQQGDSESAAILDEISQLKNGTDKNLDLVHQLATAADALRTQGERLSYKVGAFKLS